MKRWKVLGGQIAAAEKKVADAAKAAERVEAARRLLEDDPEPDLARKLRAVEAELTVALEAKRQAEADLATIGHLVERTWAPAATAAAWAAKRAASPLILGLDGPARAAEAELKRACDRVAEVITDAVAKIMMPAVAEYLTAERAYADTLAGGQAFADALVSAAVGAMPPGVVQKSPSIFEVAQPAPAPEAGLTDEPDSYRAERQRAARAAPERF